MSNNEDDLIINKIKKIIGLIAEVSGDKIQNSTEQEQKNDYERSCDEKWNQNNVKNKDQQFEEMLASNCYSVVEEMTGDYINTSNDNEDRYLIRIFGAKLFKLNS